MKKLIATLLLCIGLHANAQYTPEIGEFNYKGVCIEEFENIFYTHMKAAVDMYDSAGISLHHLDRLIAVERANIPPYAASRLHGKIILFGSTFPVPDNTSEAEGHLLILAVLLHEIGHTLGLPHGDYVYLMQPGNLIDERYLLDNYNEVLVEYFEFLKKTL